jgi:hypothetical protein
MKKVLGLLLASMVLGSTAVAAKGECCESSGQCPMAQHGHGRSDKSEYACPITEQFMDKAKFYLENAEEIGLTDEQISTIKALKLEAKKMHIRQEAEMKVFMLEVKAKMAEPKVDAAALGTMVDQASAGMAAASKALIEHYAKLKAVLSEEQAKQAKAIWKQQH